MFSYKNLFLFFLISFSLINSNALAQSRRSLSYFDSLKNELKTVKSSEDKIDIINLLSKYSLKTSLDSASIYANAAIELAKAVQYSKGKCNAFINLGHLAFLNGNIIDSFNYLNDAEKLAKNLNDPLALAEIYYTRGLAYNSIGIYNSAIEEGLKSFKIYNKYKSETDIAKMNNFFGGIYATQKKYKKAIEHVNKSLEISLKQKDTFSLGVIYLNLGITYFENDKIDKAKIYLNKALNINKKYNNQDWLSLNYQFIGNIKLVKYDFIKALENYAIALTIAEKQNNKKREVETLNSIGELYLKDNKFKEADKALEKSLRISTESGFLGKSVVATELLSNVAEKNNDPKKAFKTFKRYKILSDSLQKFNNVSKLNTLELLLNYEKDQLFLENKNQIQDAQAKKKSFIILGLVAAVSVLLFFGIMQFKLHKQKVKNNILELSKMENELEQHNRELTYHTLNMLKSNEKTNLLVDILEKHLWKIPKTQANEISKAIKEVKNNNSKNFWKEFQIRFTNVYSSFYKNLKNITEDLSPTEIKICTFLKLNMSTKDIAELTHRSPSTIEVYRTKIRKKLNLTNTNTNLQNFLSQL